MNSPARIYLDNAATSWPKPAAVYDAVDQYQRQIGAAAGRGAYRESLAAGRIVDRARTAVAQLIGASDPRRVVFGLNGTDALNLAIHGLLKPGDRVVTSVAEHNSILRPLRHSLEQLDLDVAYVGCDPSGVIDLDELRAALSRPTRLVAVTHASNVTGALQPIDEIARLAKQAGARTLIDAAQSLGHVELNVEQSGVDLLAAPGHKGLLGPLGTGLLYVAPGIEHELTPTRQGGTGTDSHTETAPGELPQRYEPGNVNVPGLAGLAAGCQYLLERTVADVRRHEISLSDRWRQELQDAPGVTLYGPALADARVGVWSLNVAGFDPQELAAILDASYGVCSRAGLHCAPRMHVAIGTDKLGGALRLSAGPFTTTDEIDFAIRVIREIAAGG